MNLAQLVRLARLECDAVRSDGTSSSLWSDEECIIAVNTALDEAFRILRLARHHASHRVLSSTDAAASQSGRYGAAQYSPTSLQITTGVTSFALPWDHVRVVSIVPLTAGFEDVRFRPSESHRDEYMDLETIPSSTLTSIGNSTATYEYTEVGKTLYFQPTPKDTIDIRMTYQFRPNKLRMTSTGTVTVSGAGVTGASTVFLSTGQIRLPADLIPGTSGSPTVPTPNMNFQYQCFSAITSDTAGTLVNALETGNLAAGTGYLVAMVPQLPEEFHAWLGQMAGAIMLRKTNKSLSGAARSALESQLMTQIQPEIAVGHQTQMSLPVEPFAIG